MKWFILSLAALPTVAAAQTTTCGVYLGKWVCQTEQPIQWQQPGFDTAQALRAYQQARQERIIAEQQAIIEAYRAETNNR